MLGIIIIIDKQQYTMPASYIPVKVEFKGDPIPSLFVPSTCTVTIIFNNEGQVIAKCVRLSACSQTPSKQDVYRWYSDWSTECAKGRICVVDGVN